MNNFSVNQNHPMIPNNQTFKLDRKFLLVTPSEFKAPNKLPPSDKYLLNKLYINCSVFNNP